MIGKNFAALRILYVVLAGYSGNALCAQAAEAQQSNVAPIQTIDEPLVAPEADLKIGPIPQKKSLTWADEQGGALSTMKEIPARAQDGAADPQPDAFESALKDQKEAEAQADAEFASEKAQAEEEEAMARLGAEAEYDLSIAYKDSDWASI